VSDSVPADDECEQAARDDERHELPREQPEVATPFVLAGSTRERAAGTDREAEETDGRSDGGARRARADRLPGHRPCRRERA
jgi:hypothetical protein